VGGWAIGRGRADGRCRGHVDARGMEEAVAAAPGGPLRRCAIANAQPQRQRRSVTGFGWERLRGQ
jgi:hypothetical protein